MFPGENMSEQEPDYEEKRQELLESIEGDEAEMRAAVQELANVATEKVQELSTVATDKVQELATATTDTVREFATAASDKLEVFDIAERIKEAPFRWLLAGFAVGAWLGARSNRPIILTDMRNYR
jgi:hypothetical protein